jgi:hypothetical protein
MVEIMHCTTFNWPQSPQPILFHKNSIRRKSKRGCAMGVALQINVALWLMLACAAIKAMQLVDALN